MMIRFRLTAVATLAVLLVVVARPLAQTGAADIALRAAIETESVKGNLPSAIDQYQKLIGNADRRIAATALLHLAGCYEKLGHADARQTYTRVVEQFADQPAAAEAARRVAALRMTTTDTLTQQLVVSKSDDRTFGHNVSRDGRFMPFTAFRAVGVLDLATGVDRWIVPAPPSGLPFLPLISPDGKMLVYQMPSRKENRDVVSVGVDGKNPHTLVPWPSGDDFGLLQDWSPDGGQLILVVRKGGGRSDDSTPSSSELRLIDARDGKTLRAFPMPFPPSAARFSPDGRYIAFENGSNGLAVLSVADGTVTKIVDDNASRPFWTPDGARVLFTRLRRFGGDRRSDLWSIRVTNGKPDGAPGFVHRDASINLAAGNGVYFYRTPNSTRDIYVVDVNPATGSRIGAPRQLTSMDDSRAPAWSPDGERLAYYTYAAPDDPQLVVKSVVDGTIQFLTDPLSSTISINPAFAWFPDGRSLLVYLANGSFGRLDISSHQMSELLSGTKVPVDVRGATPYKTSVCLSRDGHSAYFVPRSDTRTRRIAQFSLDTGVTTDVTQFEADGVEGLTISADGRQLGFIAIDGTHRETQSWTLMTVPATGGEPHDVRRFTEVGITDLAFSRDGNRLYYTSKVNRFSGGTITEVGGDIWTIGIDGSNPQPVKLGLRDEYFLRMHPNGRQLVFMEENYRNELWMLRLPTRQK